MADYTKIAWTTHTWNPWVGCMKVSVGLQGACVNCYAEAWDRRYHGGHHWGPGAERRRTSRDNWLNPLRWEKQAVETGSRPRVFTASLADFFDNEVPAAWRADAWNVIRNTPHLRWMILTKRIGNVPDMLPPDWIENFKHAGIMITVVTNLELERDGPKLHAIPGCLFKGLSIEPQMEDVDILRTAVSNEFLVITGGESAQNGRKARPYDLAWARSLIKQCRTANVSCFVKQLGSTPIEDGRLVHLKHRAGGDPNEWPADLRVRQFPEALQ